MGFRSVFAIAQDLGFWASKNAPGVSADSLLGFSGNAPVRLEGAAVPPVAGLVNAANDGAAASGGVPVGGIYRNGSVLQIRVS